MTAPFTLPLDVEVWADREEEIKSLFKELHENDLHPPQPEDDVQPEPGGAL